MTDKTIKQTLRPFVPQFVLNQLNKKRIKVWEERGCPVPPPHIVKQTIIQEYQQKYGYDIFIETGTYLGTMVEAQKSRFKKLISIELEKDLYKKAKKKFRNDKNVTIVQGDSGKVLPEILKDIHVPSIFWLDGHHSEGITAKGDKECPILEELDAIFSARKLHHILLIDDARDFTGQGDYPAIETLIEYIIAKNPTYQVEVKHDIIRCEIYENNRV